MGRPPKSLFRYFFVTLIFSGFRALWDLLPLTTHGNHRPVGGRTDAVLTAMIIKLPTPSGFCRPQTFSMSFLWGEQGWRCGNHPHPWEKESIHRPAPVHSLQEENGVHRGKILVVAMALLVFVAFLYPPPAWKVFLWDQKSSPKDFFRWWLCTLFSSLHPHKMRKLRPKLRPRKMWTARIQKYCKSVEKRKLRPWSKFPPQQNSDHGPS